jgi:hypothetical protein
LSVGEPVFAGRIIRNGYTVEKYLVQGEGDYIIPYLLFKPQKSGEKYLIYLHPSGKSAEASAGGEIERFVFNGYTVLVPDLLGTGEMGPGNLNGDASFEGISHNIWYASMLIGRSITGIQAGDISRLILIIKMISNKARISGFARREMAAVLLHAAVFDSSIESLTLVEPFSSYRSIVMNRFYCHSYILSSVPGALQEYDLPDLAAAIAPGRLVIAGITDGNGKSDDTDGIMKDIEIIKAGYKIRNAEDRLIILPDKSDESVYKFTGIIE